MSVFKNVMIGLDQTLNCLFRLDGEWGLPDETLSARAWRVRERHPNWQVWLDRLFFLGGEGEKGHCQISWEREAARAHLPGVYSRDREA